MTGTAQTEAAELSKTYKLGVVPIPTNKPPRRVDQADLVYKTEPAKFEAVADDVAEHFERGQPVLIGTTSVERSEYLAKLLTSRGVEHSVLNAKFHEQEAQIIAEAGRRGLGHRRDEHGRPRHRHRARRQPRLHRRPAPAREGARPRRLPRGVRGGVGRDPRRGQGRGRPARPIEVKEAGGLYVLGTERHESRRIDNQLRGRSGTSGRPGESRFYLSLGDELMRRFNGAMVESIMTRFNLPEDMPIEAKMVSRAIRSAQTQVEQQNFEARKDILEYDEVMNQQRTVIYAERHRVLEGENLSEQVQNMIVDTVTAYVDGATSEGYSEDWDLEKLWTGLGQLYPVGVRWQDLVEEQRGHRPRHAGRAPHRGRAGGLRQARGRDRRHRAPGRDARAGAAGRPVGARPQVARAPLRDGLPQAGHRPAGDGPARSQDRVQARGLRDVHLHDGGHPRGVRRVPVQPDHPGRGAGPRRRRARGEPDDGHQRPGGDHPGHPGPAHQPDADHVRRRAAARRPAGGRRADQRDPGAAARTRRAGPASRRGPVRPRGGRRGRGRPGRGPAPESQRPGGGQRNGQRDGRGARERTPPRRRPARPRPPVRRCPSWGRSRCPTPSGVRGSAAVARSSWTTSGPTRTARRPGTRRRTRAAARPA